MSDKIKVSFKNWRNWLVLPIFLLLGLAITPLAVLEFASRAFANFCEWINIANKPAPKCLVALLKWSNKGGDC